MNLIDRARRRLDAGHMKGGYTDSEGIRCCLEGALIMALLDEDADLEKDAGRFEPGDVFYTQDTSYDQIAHPFVSTRRSERFVAIRMECEAITDTQFPDRGPFAHIAEFNDHPDTTLDEIYMVLDKAAANLPPEVLGD